MTGAEIMIRTLLLSIVTLMALTGCTAKLADPEISFAPPEYVEEMPAKEEEQDFAPRGSIFGQGENPLFSDHKAMHVNDIVTVEIIESATSINSASRALSKSDNLELGGGVATSSGSNPAINSLASKVSGITNIGFTAESGSSFSGSGSTSKDASFATTISARIIKVLQNGNYFIAGRREIMIDSEKQIIQISGVIRPYDIDQNNMIASTQIADAKIYYGNQGDVDRSTQRAWGSKLVNAVWPF
jgi:flagellar L-ring protein precursor FlgH